MANDRSTEILIGLEDLQAQRIDEDNVAAALKEFDSVWNVLSPKEQARPSPEGTLFVEMLAFFGAIDLTPPALAP